MYNLVEQDYPIYSMELTNEFNLEPQIYDSVFGQN